MLTDVIPIDGPNNEFFKVYPRRALVVFRIVIFEKSFVDCDSCFLWKRFEVWKGTCKNIVALFHTSAKVFPLYWIVSLFLN